MSTWRLTGVAGVATTPAGARWRLSAIAGQTSTAGSAKWRMTGLVGSGTPLVPLLSVQLTALEDNAEPFDIIHLIANVTGGTPTSYLFQQILGPTVVLSGSGNSRTFEAPALRTQSALRFRVTITPGDLISDVDVGVWPANEFFLTTAGSFEPRRQQLL